MSLFQNIILKKYLADDGEKIAAAYNRIALRDRAEDFDFARTTCRNLSTQITVTDREIDQLVYNLYGLTDDEIAIIEK